MKCTHDPRETEGPIGMYHCDECGQMVIAGMQHPDYDLLNNPEAMAELESQVLITTDDNCEERKK